MKPEIKIRHSDIFWKIVKNIKPEECDSPDEPGSNKYIDASLIFAADDLIRRCGGCVTSGYRSVAHNKKVGGKTTSSHRKGYALDIGWTRKRTSRELYQIMEYLIICPCRRIGIDFKRNMIHLDNHPDKVQNVIWTY